jgi:dienelactone hydrolase
MCISGLKRYAFSLILMASVTTSWAGVMTKTVEYKGGGTSFEGLSVVPSGIKGKAPGILMIHNWMGVTDETKHQAERVAALGYNVVAADIYGKDVRPKSPQEAGALAGKYKSDRKLYRERLELALSVLKSMPTVDAGRIIAVGYCFGGTGVIELARTGADIKGVVSFHGGLDGSIPPEGKNIKAKVLALHGADDPFVKAEDVAAFENEMRVNKVDWQLIKYGGAVHSFTEKGAGSDNSKGAAYNAAADQRSFEAFSTFAKNLF